MGTFFMNKKISFALLLSLLVISIFIRSSFAQTCDVSTSGGFSCPNHGKTCKTLTNPDTGAQGATCGPNNVGVEAGYDRRCMDTETCNGHYCTGPVGQLYSKFYRRFQVRYQCTQDVQNNVNIYNWVLTCKQEFTKNCDCGKQPRTCSKPNCKSFTVQAPKITCTQSGGSCGGVAGRAPQGTQSLYSILSGETVPDVLSESVNNYFSEQEGADVCFIEPSPTETTVTAETKTAY